MSVGLSNGQSDAVYTEMKEKERQPET